MRSEEDAARLRSEASVIGPDLVAAVATMEQERRAAGKSLRQYQIALNNTLPVALYQYTIFGIDLACFAYDVKMGKPVSRLI